MSAETIKQIIGRALSEPEFKELLLGDPGRALEGYELTEEEATALKALTPQEFDAIGGDLEDRISRALMMRPTLFTCVVGGCGDL